MVKSLIPSWETKIPDASWSDKKKKNKKNHPGKMYSLPLWISKGTASCLYDCYITYPSYYVYFYLIV